MKKDIDSNKANAPGRLILSNLDAESIEIVRIAGRKRNTSDNPREIYRMWRCNGVIIVVHLHRRKP